MKRGEKERRKAEVTRGLGGCWGPCLAGGTWTMSGSCPIALLQPFKLQPPGGISAVVCSFIGTEQ